MPSAIYLVAFAIYNSQFTTHHSPFTILPKPLPYRSSSSCTLPGRSTPYWGVRIPGPRHRAGSETGTARLAVWPRSAAPRTGFSCTPGTDAAEPRGPCAPSPSGAGGSPSFPGVPNATTIRGTGAGPKRWRSLRAGRAAHRRGSDFGVRGSQSPLVATRGSGFGVRGSPHRDSGFWGSGFADSSDGGEGCGAATSALAEAPGAGEGFCSSFTNSPVPSSGSSSPSTPSDSPAAASGSANPAPRIPNPA